MQDKVTWLSHLVRRFARLNNLTPLRADDAVLLRPQREPGSRSDAFWRCHGAMAFRDTGANYRGSKLVTYNTVSIDTLFLNITPEVWLYNPKSLQEIAGALIARYGLPLQKEWFADAVFDYTVMPQVVRLTLNSTMFTKESTVDVTVRRSDVNIADLFKSNVLVTPQIGFTVQTARTSAEFTYAHDFTPQNMEEYGAILAYPTGAVVAEATYNGAPIQTLKGLIEERLGNPVAYEVTSNLTADQVCFKNSQLIYNGPTRGYVHPDHLPWRPGADTWYDKVLVISFDTATSGFQGLAYFHYNDLT